MLDYINGLRKYRWLHIAVIIHMILFLMILIDFILFTFGFKSMITGNLTWGFFGFIITVYLLEVPIACLLILIFIIMQILKPFFKNVNIVKNNFLLHSHLYTPFFTIGVLCTIFSIIICIKFIYIIL